MRVALRKVRPDEVLETFRAETTRHEQVFLVGGGGPAPVLVYVMDVDDPEQASRAFRDSVLPVDVRHREVMERVDDGPADAELLLDIRLADDGDGDDGG